jgi:hypothetical protein
MNLSRKACPYFSTNPNGPNFLRLFQCVSFKHGSKESSNVSCKLLGTFLGKTAPENSNVTLNSLFPEDSASTDSDEDLSDELDEFFAL